MISLKINDKKMKVIELNSITCYYKITNRLTAYVLHYPSAHSTDK